MSWTQRLQTWLKGGRRGVPTRAESTFEERERQQALLRTQLAAAPVVQVTGVVQAGGASGAKAADATLWDMSFRFTAWRVASGKLNTKSLTLRRPVSRIELHAHIKSIVPKLILRVEARVIEDSVIGSPQAMLEKIIGREDADQGLAAFVASLPPPITLTDARLGTLTRETDDACWSVVLPWNDEPVRLDMFDGEPDERAQFMATARGLLDGAVDWDRKLKACAAETLLDEKNSKWLAEGERAISSDEFMRRMKPEFIFLACNETFQFAFSSSDLFPGQFIVVDCCIATGPTGAHIE